MSAKGAQCVLGLIKGTEAASFLAGFLPYPRDVPFTLTRSRLVPSAVLSVSAKGTRAAKGMREVERWGIGVLEGR